MARLASLIAAVAGAAIAFTIGWILGYVLAPMEDAEADREATYRAALAAGLSDAEAREEGYPQPAPDDEIGLRKRLEHVHELLPNGYGAPVWTSEVEAAQGFPTDAMRRRGEHV